MNQSVAQAWKNLLIPACGEYLSSLLALRRVSRFFLEMLHSHPIWLKHTMFMIRLSYDERVAGWRGVLIARERVRKMLNPTIPFDPFVVFRQTSNMPSHEHICCIASRVVVIFSKQGENYMFNMDGDLIFSFVMEPMFFQHGPVIVQDRWLILPQRDCVRAYDCVKRELSVIVAEITTGGHFRYSASGDVVCLQFFDCLMFYRFDFMTGSCTYIRRLGTIRTDRFIVCDNGKRYAAASRHTIWIGVVDRIDQLSTFSLSGKCADNSVVFTELLECTGYILARVRHFEQYYAFRVADGHMSEHSFVWKPSRKIHCKYGMLYNPFHEVNLDTGTSKAISQVSANTVVQEQDLSSGLSIFGDYLYSSVTEFSNGVKLNELVMPMSFDYGLVATLSKDRTIKILKMY
jgi:hypothetical protein